MKTNEENKRIKDDWFAEEMGLDRNSWWTDGPTPEQFDRLISLARQTERGRIANKLKAEIKRDDCKACTNYMKLVAEEIERLAEGETESKEREG